MALDVTEFIEKLPPIRIPGLHSTESIGIDLGSSSIKIVQIKNVNNKCELIRWAILPVAFMAEGDKTESSPEEKMASITSILKNYYGTGKKIPKIAITSVSGSSVIVRYVKLPKLNRKELDKALKTEAEPYIPFNIEEVFIAVYPLRDIVEDGKPKMEAVLVAAKKDFVNQRIQILEQAGFKVSVIDVDAFAIESAHEANLEALPKEETVLVANMGFSKTNFLILDKGVSIVVKDSPISGQVMNKAIMKSSLADFRTAEKLKILYGIVPKQAAETTQIPKEVSEVSDAILLVLKDFVAEAKKIVQFYVTQGKDKKIDRVVICGGSANIKNLIPYLAQELNLPVEKFNPFKNIQGSQGVPEENLSTLACAVGLALRKPGDTAIQKKASTPLKTP